MSAAVKQPAIGQRLPYLLGKLKAPRVLERLEQTAERARSEDVPLAVELRDGGPDVNYLMRLG